MTASPTVLIGRHYRFSPVRTLFCGVLLSALVAACLYVYHTAFTFYHARLLENEMKTIAWFTEQIGLSLPLIVICLFHYLVYHAHDRHDGAARREMMWEIVIVAVLTYAVLLPYLSRVSRDMYEAAVEAGATIPETDGKVPWTLLMKLHEWFVRQPIPLCLLFLFHRVRATRELQHPETEVRPAPVTVEEYYARCQADTAKAPSVDTDEAEPATPSEHPAPSDESHRDTASSASDEAASTT